MPGDPLNPNPDPNNPPPNPTAPLSPSIEDLNKKLDQLLQVSADAATKAEEVRKKQEALETRLSKPPEPPAPDQPKTKFFDDPDKALDRIKSDLKADFDKTVEPLFNFVEEVRGGGQYDKVKSELKSDPRLAKIMAIPGIESRLDAAMEKQKNKSRETAIFILTSTYGAAQAGLIPDITIPKDDGNNPPSPPPDTTVPPTVRTSAPPPRQKEPPKVRELTENEKTLARRAGMSAEEYLASQGEGSQAGTEHAETVIETAAPKKKEAK